MSLPSRTERVISGWPGQWLVVITGLVVTGLLAGQAAVGASRTAAETFRADAERAVEAIEAQIGLGVGAAEAAAGLVVASEEVTVEEFRRFTRALQVSSRYPELSALALVTAIPAAPPDGLRWVVSAIEPVDGNDAAMGADIRQDPVVRLAGETAVDRRQPIMTGPIDLRGILPGETGLSVLVPVYDGMVADADRAERRARHRGFMATFFRAEDLLAVALVGVTQLSVTVVDADAAGTGGVLGSYLPPGTGVLPEDRRTEVVQREVFGRRWVVTVSAIDGYGVAVALPVTIAVSGVVLTLLLVLLLRGADRSGQRARTLAAIATAELRASEAALAHANQELSRHNRALQRANVELGRFASAASHDLKQPVQLVIAFTELLRELLITRLGEDGLEEMEQLALAKVEQGGLRMRQLIDDLLDLAVADRGAERFREMDVRPVVEDVVDGLRAAHAAFTVRVEQADPVVMDERQLLPLLQNLIGNAVKYRRPDRPPVVRISAINTEGSWRLSVVDNGIGIPPQDREEVLRAFTRLDRGSGVEGSGVGLAICAAIADGHGGDIRVEDGDDGGTAIVITIPQPPRPPVGSPPPAPAGTGESVGSRP